MTRTTDVVVPEVQQMAGAAALPRDNGELVFEAPWQGRVLAMALAVVERRGLEWDEFRRRLIAAIESEPGRSYYESWTTALVDLLVELGVVTETDLDARATDSVSGEPR